jgi:four helix bundle protein
MGFESLRVYQAAQLLDREVNKLVRRLRGRFADDVRQLERTIGSILFNIAEAYGSEYAGRKRYHLQVARGACDEARSVLNRLADKGAWDSQEISRSCGLTSAIAKMLTSWINKMPTELQSQ